MRLALWFTIFATSVPLWACTPQAAQPAKAPTPEPAKSDWKQVEPTKQKVPIVAEPAGVPAAPDGCKEYLAHSNETCKTPTATSDASREALARALAASAPLERDAQLVCLENESSLPPGLVRALRAELAPVGCGDVLAMPFLEPRRAELDRSIEDTLIALAAGGRLARLVQQAPELSPPFDKPHFMDFFQSTLKPWIVTQAQAIHELSLSGARLSAYAKGIVAIEAGLADMRFVSVVRKVALPKEMNDDAEVRETYYAALDEALEPRKARGRDAALVGLREFASIGILADARVERARALLSEVYAGRRIDALDKLLLPPLSPAADDTTERKLALRLPTFYAGTLLATSALDAPLLRALLERGLPRALAAQLDPSKLDDTQRDFFVRALIERGRRYFRAEDFALAARLSASDKPRAERALYHALASSLQNGPRDASELILRGPQLPTGAMQVAELDGLASEKNNPSAPLAAFDAAYLLGLAPPQNDAKFWEALAKRYDSAARALKDPAQKRVAHDASAAAKETARALTSNKSPQLPQSN
ncbi:MAG TPA: hypothetical protein VER96_18380 [Polyangiaceae bacterium]|nr:hypothetical protein [Polyangiaceae bacterium]